MNTDLISHKALLERIKEDAPWWWQNFHSYLIVDMIKDAPGCGAEPVRHGEWIYDPNATDWGIGGYVCSECHTKNNNLPCNEFKNPLRFVGSNFCPHCGAKMDGGTNDGQNP